ncbi:TRZ/ATZ family hydrolase [Nitrosomonas ureae]|uniref:5-methylthioadenosine/S-adenosylhomocysteine deaminase n=1 Tax=Nitrosomonas ureae TaxID=44577 RepID=A0A1H2G2Y8_9PROT|nr:TRZ/ATZ family hydrolase [Nitrosomonas ureae]ALQ52145.1 N-ethylammeline chlorohydrolase [Nitrosomonas ureae]SDU13931.1 5-methylthioadenosine/S-adenosylhomocysteine deaminase [Nitrosomonas ureae]
MSNREEIDTLIEAKWIIPVEPAEIVLNQHAIAIDHGIIKNILPIAEASQRYQPQQTFTLNDHALIPGLVNLHTHAAMTLLRGLADDLPLMEWLNKHIWPAENQYVNAQFVLDGTRLACAEMIKGGITCFNDMYFFPESCAQAAASSGMRAAIGMIVIDFPTTYASDADDYLAKGLELRDKYQHNPLLSFCFAPHAPYTVSDKTFNSILTYAEQLDAAIHIHLHETQDEIRISMESSGVRPIERMQQLGLLSPNLIAVHMVHLTDHEIKLLHQYNCSIAHCPSSNMKLASGFAPISSLVNQGVNVGLGTDGAASNNRLDMFEEMRLAALLAKANSGRADALPAHQVLRMATLNGANALGLGESTGSLTVGKAADIAAIDFSHLNLTPCYDPVSHLIYAASREHVSHVWVNGRILLEDKELTTLNEAELHYRAAMWQERITATSQQLF